MRTAFASAVAAALGVLAVATLAEASGSAQQKSTLSTYYAVGAIGIGDVATIDARCRGSNEFAIAGGFQMERGNFLWVVGTGAQKDGRGWFVRGLVPNKIAAPGVLQPTVLVKTVCAEKGKAVVP